MRGLFSIAAILVTLLIVAMVVKQQLHATVAVPASQTTPGNPPPVDPMKAEQQVRDGVAAAAAEAQRRNDAADKAN